MSHEGAFVCNAPGCGQRFDNEGYLAIHQHKHEMTLKFTAPRSDSVIVSDQTPTPTRFLKNCEEVGLFNDLNSPYELDFKKEQDEEEKKHALDLRTAPPGEGRPRGGDEETRRSRPRGSPTSHSAEIERDSSSAATPLARPATLPLGRPGARPYFLTGHSPGMLVQQALPSPTSPSVITQAPSSHRHLAALPGPLPLFLHLPNGQTMPLGAVTSPTMPIPTALSMPLSTIPSPVGMIPSPVGMIPSPVGMIPHIPGIPGPHMFSHGLPPPPPAQLPSPSESRMRLKQILAQQASSLHELHELHELHGLGLGGGGGCGGGARPVSRDSLPSPHERQLKEEGSSRRAESRPWESPYHEMNVKMESPVDDGGHGPPSFGGLTSASSDGGGGGAGGGGGGVRRRRSSVEDPEERRRRFLERNRAAATRCRLKRKAWVHSLERKAEDLADSNVQLQAEVTLLRSEVAHLKQLLLAHKDCPVTAMQIKQGYLRGSTPSEPAASAPLHGRSAPPPPAPPPPPPPHHRAPPSPDSDFNDGAASPVAAAAAAAAVARPAVAAAGASGGSSGQGSLLATQQQQQQQHVIVGPPRAQPVSR